MGKHAGAHKMEKRRKEITRQKKQEEKRKKRLMQKGSDTSTVGDMEGAATVEDEPGTAEPESGTKEEQQA